MSLNCVTEAFLLLCSRFLCCLHNFFISFQKVKPSKQPKKKGKQVSDKIYEDYCEDEYNDYEDRNVS